ESFAFGDADADDFVILQYVLTNLSSQSLSGLRVGLFTDWDLPGTAGDPFETAGWDPSLRLGSVEGSENQPALGVVWLDDVPVAQIGYAAVTRDEIVQGTTGNPAAGRGVQGTEAPDLFAGEFSDAEKWELLTSGQSRTTVSEPADVFQIIGRGPLTLAAGASDTVAVALVAATDRAALRQAAEAAREVYFDRILLQDPPPPPPPSDDVELAQNFPNPFRPGGSTTISFSVPGDVEDARARLVIYDVLGRPVRTLVDREVIPGDQVVTWDGRSETGAEVAAGVYVARLSASGVERSIRILVIP
ncbi:MAG: FlgD immunoglobulin-like domain containing protein, partial [Gemmatimonadota bacterium]